MKPLTKMIPKISLKQLYYFVAVAEVGKVNTAANTISITPSSITEAIKHLERMLDTQLFERASDGMHLTFDGYRLLEQAQTIAPLSGMSAGARPASTRQRSCNEVYGVES